MRTLTILSANPRAEVRVCAGETEIVSSPPSISGGAEATPASSVRDGVRIQVRTDDEGRAVHLAATRSVSTGDELFYLVRPDGDLVLTDHFRCALSRLPPEHRVVPEASVADHLLFRTTPGTNTYVRGIERLAHGERLEWTAQEGFRTSRVDALRPRTLRERSEEQLDAVEGALEDALRVPEPSGGLVNMLSGGIDSTLIHTFLGPDVPSTSVAIDSGEFSLEVRYAREASRLLGTRHELLRLEESRYLEHLEGSIETLGIPPHHLQTVLLDRAFQGPYRGYVTGQLADALFGLESSLLGWRAWSLRALLRAPLVARAASLAGSAMRARVSRLAAAERRVARAPADPLGYAMEFAIYSDLPLARRMVGERLVEERLQARLEYVRSCVELPTESPDALSAHLELGHWLDFYCDDTVSLWRQLAHGRGKFLIAPFTNPEVARAALEVAVRDRYVRRGTAKHLLKSLLKRRLPAYPVHQPKGGSGLPFVRYAQEGPLREVFRRYAIPDFAGLEDARALLSTPSWITWNAMTYAIWSSRVLHSRTLAPPEHTRTCSWTVSPS